MNRQTKFFLLIAAALTIFACIYWVMYHKETSIETITFFPIDETTQFLDAKTVIGPIKTSEKNGAIPVSTFSRLDQPAYLRQDITLAYANGRLIGKFGKWQENTDSIQNEEKFQINKTQVFHVLTLHHAELHHNDQAITSVQNMTDDQVYIVQSNVPSLLSFKTPSTEEEISLKEGLDNAEKTVITNSLNNAAKKNKINLEQYYIIPLIDLPKYKNKPFPSFSQKQTNEVIGRLWEGLYKNYFLGIKKSDGKIVSPIGTTIPVILLSKDETHLYVVFETANNEPFLLKQLISK